MQSDERTASFLRVFLCSSICLRLSVLRRIIVCRLTQMRPDRPGWAGSGRAGPGTTSLGAVHAGLGGKPHAGYEAVQTCESPSNPVSPPTRVCKQAHRWPSRLPPMAEVREAVVLWGGCPPALSKQAGGSYRGLLCILTFPSRRTQSRCPPALQRSEGESRACTWLLLTHTICASNSL